ncbi:MAG: hypothetical protein Q7U33_00995 [Methylotenera sp.]|uniref:hypothetical protein n=1 Tax=Methylotenera sp. TaxID=2051956 RepID=UPI0027224EFC|nr:hypothetical protein [Methylotenera sp.]MDO9149935.1 hypothetical protein [Methylotenera sp.]
MSATNTHRWELLNVDIKLSRFQVLDKLINSKKHFYVANIKSVTLEANNAYVETLTGKTMLVRLATNARRIHNPTSK